MKNNLYNLFSKDLIKKSENKIFVERKKRTLALNESFISAISLFNDFEKERIIKASIEKYPTDEFVNPFVDNLKNYCGLSSEDQILIGNGIDELLYFLFISINDRNTKCVVNVPAYPDYKNYGQSCGINFIELPLIEKEITKKLENNLIDNSLESGFEFVLNIEKLIKTRNKKDIKAIIFTNPNNPTGTIFSLSDIIYVTERLPEKLIIIDEAYIEFCLDKTLVSLINEFDNLIILRTFSKGFLSPGLRLGYLVSNENIIKQLKKVFPVFPVSQISIEIGKILLEKREQIQKIREIIIGNRNKIYTKLKEFMEKDLIEKVYKSDTNFVLFKFNNPKIMIDFYNYLLENEISIRNVSSRYIQNSLRVTASDDEQTDYFLKYMENFFDKNNIF
ncbi:MAG: pyridoxal phosphate-dependent aminotransferase [Exilispira sp.]